MQAWLIILSVSAVILVLATVFQIAITNERSEDGDTDY